MQLLVFTKQIFNVFLAAKMIKYPAFCNKKKVHTYCIYIVVIPTNFLRSQYRLRIHVYFVWFPCYCINMVVSTVVINESFPFKCAKCKSFNFLELIVLGRWREKYLHTMLCTNDLCCCEKLWQVISNEMYTRFQSHTNWFCCAEFNHTARDGMIINVFQQFFRFSLAQFMMRTSKVKAILFNIDVNAVKRCSLFNKSQSCLLHK